MLDLEKLRKAREKARLTQEQAAKKTGFASRQAWNNVERGRVGIALATLDKIATALGVKPKDLLK